MWTNTGRRRQVRLDGPARTASGRWNAIRRCTLAAADGISAYGRHMRSLRPGRRDHVGGRRRHRSMSSQPGLTTSENSEVRRSEMTRGAALTSLLSPGVFPLKGGSPGGQVGLWDET
jgi:hypothetical protein